MSQARPDTGTGGMIVVISTGVNGRSKEALTKNNILAIVQEVVRQLQPASNAVILHPLLVPDIFVASLVDACRVQ